MSLLDQNEGSFERHPRMDSELKEKGQIAEVIFCDDGREISAETLKASMEKKRIENIKAIDSMVFVINWGEDKYELWLKKTQFTNIAELKKIREENGGKLAGAKVKIERIDVANPKAANWRYSYLGNGESVIVPGTEAEAAEEGE